MFSAIRKYFALMLLLLAPGLLAAGNVHGQEQAPLRRVAVIPFSRVLIQEKIVDVTDMIRSRLLEIGIEVVDNEVLEKYLAEKRIRRAKFLDRPSIILLGDKLDADALVMGFADLMMSGGAPQVTLNVQIVDCNEVKVIWAGTKSYSGNDFTTFLGFGTIDDPVRLTERVIRDLLHSLPRFVPAVSKEIRPFVISRAALSQKWVHGGQNVRFEVEVKSLEGKVESVKALFRNEKVNLERKALELFAGELTAPAEQANYEVDLIVEDERGQTHEFSEVALIQVFNTPPGLKVVSRQTAFSPNGDGFLDAAGFSPIVEKKIELKQWTYEIRDSEGKPAYRRKGIGVPPDTIIWQGVDNRMNKVPDGEYFFWIEVTDLAGNTSEIKPRKIVLDTSPPEIKVRLEQAQDKTLLFLSCDEISPMAYWEISLKEPSGKEIRRFSGLDNVPETLNITGSLPQEKLKQKLPLTFDLVARDALGNGVRSKGLEVEIPSQREEEKETKIWIEDF